MDKACPVVIRRLGSVWQVLAFEHPIAGKQFVKGTIEAGEAPHAAAIRELKEESGIEVYTAGRDLGHARLCDGLKWSFYLWKLEGLADRWLHQTEDDYGHEFAFFWHPLEVPLNDEWAPVFHDAHSFLISNVWL